MKTKCVTLDNPDAESVAVQALDGRIPDAWVCLHSGRNTVWRTPEGMAVKIFGYSPLKSLIYALRTTKARRSYDNARLLKRRAIGTPAPIAYAERRGAAGRLLKSVYICAYEDSVPLADMPDPDGSLTRAFAYFVARMHYMGLLHGDLNATNVRVKQTPQGPEFSLIDLNRMKYCGNDDAPDKRFDDLTRWTSAGERYTAFVSEYVRYEYRHSPNQEELIDAALERKRQHDRAVDRKKAFKRWLRRLTGRR